MLRAMLLLAFASWTLVAGAQGGVEAYPQKPVRLIVGLAPGGNPDTFARLAANALSQRLNQQFIVENRPGASSNVAADAVIKAPADGHTILVGSSGIFTINPQVYASMPFDPLRDLSPVALSVATTMWLVVHPSVPVSSVAELVSYARSQPKPLAYASSGNGSIHHITMETFKAQAGVDLQHIPFKGASQSVPALLSGDVQVAFIGYPTIAQPVKSGRLKALAFSMGRRSSLTPEIPTVAESGVPGFDMAGQTGVFVSSKTPRPLVQRLSQLFNEAIRVPDVAQKLIAVGMEPIGSTPEQFEKILRSEMERDAGLAKRLGLKGE
jgi:tripartite-type tricarboxylate transporter receptor subunit TctC